MDLYIFSWNFFYFFLRKKDEKFECQINGKYSSKEHKGQFMKHKISKKMWLPSKKTWKRGRGGLHRKMLSSKNGVAVKSKP